MVQEIKRFLTHDGREFPSLELAEEPEQWQGKGKQRKPKQC